MKQPAPESAGWRLIETAGKAQAALETLPALMQVVQTFIRRAPPCGICTRIDCRFGSNRLGVRLLACETLLPNCGPLPQTSQRLAIFIQPPEFSGFFTGVFGIIRNVILP